MEPTPLYSYSEDFEVFSSFQLERTLEFVVTVDSGLETFITMTNRRAKKKCFKEERREAEVLSLLHTFNQSSRKHDRLRRRKRSRECGRVAPQRPRMEEIPGRLLQKDVQGDGTLWLRVVGHSWQRRPVWQQCKDKCKLVSWPA